MSKLLALDTSSDACSLALWLDGEVTADFQFRPRQHAQALLPQIQQLLGAKGLRLEHLDALAFGRGPGSFTGLRIAAASIQGLALAADLPVVPVSTLQALALQARQQYFARQLLTVIDARMDEVYWCAWQVDEDEPRALLAEQLSRPEKVLPLLPEDQDWLLVGSGCVHAERLPARVRARLCQEVPNLLPDAAAMVQLAALAWERGEAVDAAAAQPVYLRDRVTG